MAHLKELGLDCSNASMCHYRVLYSWHYEKRRKEVWKIDFLDTFGDSPVNFEGVPDCDGMNNAEVMEVIPAFCLQDIMEILQTARYMSIGFRVLYFLWDIELQTWNFLFRNPYGFENPETRSRTPLESAYKTLCWCLENGKIEGYGRK